MAAAQLSLAERRRLIECLRAGDGERRAAARRFCATPLFTASLASLVGAVIINLHPGNYISKTFVN